MDPPHGTRFTIRSAVVADAEAIGQMAQGLNEYLQGLGDDCAFQLTAERVRSDGFGPEPAFAVLVAERESIALGYLLYHQAYDSDVARRYLVVCDLYVRADARQEGVGRALLEAAMSRCRDSRCCGLSWAVFRRNRLAMDFYRGLGARAEDHLSHMWWPAKD